MSFHDLKDSFISVVSTIEPIDAVDIFILTYFIFLLLKLIRETRAGQLAKGILLLVAGYFVSKFIGLKTITYILQNMLSIGVLALIILFQPELRRALEKAGRTKFGVKLFGIGQNTDEMRTKWKPAIESICDSCVELSATCTGALIVVERQVRLGEQIETGTILNADPSKEVFGNIFYPKTPLHDGAVIMRDGWSAAEARAKDSELVFKRSEKEFLKVLLRICNDLSDLSLKLSAIEIRFTRRNYENISEKANVLVTMLGNGKIAPQLAFTHCGLFSDPQLAYKMSMEYLDETGGNNGINAGDGTGNQRHTQEPEPSGGEGREREDRSNRSA